MNRSLRVSLTSLLIALSLIPSLAVGAALGWGIFQQERGHALELERQVNDQGAAMISTYLARAEDELYHLMQDSSLRSADADTRAAALSKALLQGDTFDELAITDAAGVELARATRLGIAPAGDLHDHSGDPIFVEPRRTDKSYFHGFEASPVNGEPLLWMSIPTLSVETGQSDGVLIARVRLGRIFDQVINLPLGEDGALMVLDRDGRIIAHRNLASLGTRTPPAPPADGVAQGVSGVRVLQTRLPVTVGNLPFTLAAELPLDEADADLRQAMAMAGLLLFVVAIVTTVLCVAAVNQIASPIRELAAATQRLGAGDTVGQVAVTRQDEIGALQRDFNQMVSDLREQRAAVEQRTAELQTSLDKQHDLLETVALLSTPLLPVWDGVVVLPIVGHVDAERGEALTNALITGVAQRRARVAILDITGLAVVNDEVVAILLRAAQAVELLGARAMLAGVSAKVAQRIVATGLSLHGLASFRDLQSATEAAITRPA
jgi:anti-anti-sigma regulatory factor/HAMP domain-containing protein